MKKVRPISLNSSETTAVDLRFCDHEGCEASGEFRAPKSPQCLRDYYWFCLDHVRKYNKTWDFYKGMTLEEIEASRISDITWNRPSWPVGGWRALLENATYLDGLEAFLKGLAPAPVVSPEVQKALSILELSLPLTIETLKKQYKKLAKRHHPDLNAGSKKAEERLKIVNQAYQTLKKHLEQ